MADLQWRLSAESFDRFNALAFRVNALLDPHCEEAIVLREEIRALPGFPRHFHEDLDTIIPVVVGRPMIDLTLARGAYL